MFTKEKCNTLFVASHVVYYDLKLLYKIVTKNNITNI